MMTPGIASASDAHYDAHEHSGDQGQSPSPQAVARGERQGSDTRTTRTITSTLTLGGRLLESDVMRTRSAMAYASTDSGLSMTCRSGDIPERCPGDRRRTA